MPPAMWGATPPPKISPQPITKPETAAIRPAGAASAGIGPARMASAPKLNIAATNSRPNSIPISAPV